MFLAQSQYVRSNFTSYVDAEHLRKGNPRESSSGGTGLTELNLQNAGTGLTGTFRVLKNKYKQKGPYIHEAYASRHTHRP